MESLVSNNQVQCRSWYPGSIDILTVCDEWLPSLVRPWANYTPKKLICNLKMVVWKGSPSIPQVDFLKQQKGGKQHLIPNIQQQQQQLLSTFASAFASALGAALGSLDSGMTRNMGSYRTSPELQRPKQLQLETWLWALMNRRFIFFSESHYYQIGECKLIGIFCLEIKGNELQGCLWLIEQWRQGIPCKE